MDKKGLDRKEDRPLLAPKKGETMGYDPQLVYQRIRKNSQGKGKSPKRVVVLF